MRSSHRPWSPRRSLRWSSPSGRGGPLLAVGTFALLMVAFAYLSWTRPKLEGMPVLIVHDGVMNKELMRYERLPDTERFEAMREQGIEDLSSVRVGILEPDGKFSFFAEREHQPAPEKPQE